MSAAKHTSYTPGPWKAYSDGASVWTAQAGAQIASCRWHVADSGELAGECVQDIHAARANALLIAAAPELLEALQDVAAWLKATPEGYETVPPDSYARAVAAIAKAVQP